MSLIQWPNVRKAYSGIINPVFVDDIKAANQGLMDAIAVVTGMNSTDFAILSGMEYVPGVQNTYNPGWFYFEGQIYFQATSFNELLYLQPNPTDTLPEAFIDPTATKDIYTINYSVSSNTALGNTPQFSGNMNAYRVGLKYTQSILLSLGTAAFLNAGTTTGTLGDGGILTTAVNNLAALTANVLQLNNVGVYTPSAQYNPATKGYVDSAVGILTVKLHGNHSQGTCISDTLVTISLGVTLTSNNYTVLCQLISQTPTSPASEDNDVIIAVRNKTTTSFDVYIGPPTSISGPNNVGFDWILFQ